MKLVSKSDPFFSMLSMAAEDDFVDVGNLKYMFAVQNMDPRVGRVKA